MQNTVQLRNQCNEFDIKVKGFNLKILELKLSKQIEQSQEECDGNERQVD
ncbi:unnamed protein product [Paramecium pentaurelia]|uniref:Uncharacterized protein n=1 Tax=Paramecium pentaurelia TaxID=43138 RepID=A0A8S1WZN6_9CILI|nr:unnamed protein product [Paramecium pentaurelia]CAD8194836.1 unnamed protein product [Paramecium pentaurelia]